MNPVFAGELSPIAWLSLSSALAICGLSGSYAASRAGTAWAEPLFWLSILLLAVPIAIRLLGTVASRRERIILLLILGLGLYLAKVLQSPLAFTLYDELQHLRPAIDILDSGRLFAGNPLLPVYTYFPGLEIATTAIAAISGHDLFMSGIVIIGAARVLLLIGLFLLYEFAGVSARTASIAVTIYAANPNFVFFGGQFSYESLALPIAIGILVLVAFRESEPRARVRATVAAMLAIGALTVTHHVTSYALIGFLVIWALAEIVAPAQIVVSRGTEPESRDGPGVGRLRVALPVGVAGLALFAGVLAAAWMLYIAQIAVRYLAPAVANLGEFLKLLLGLTSSRALFVTASGPAPVWEPIVSFASVGLILLALPFGWWLAWGAPGGRALRIVLAIVALSYPASLALRLSPRGAEISSRTTDFVFVGVALIVGLAVARIPGRVVSAVARPALAVAVAVLFVGGLTIGTPAWARLPGPYRVSGDARSIEPEGIEAAKWMDRVLGPDHRIATDRINRLLMGVYGHQTPITEFAHGVQTALLFQSPSWTTEDVALLRAGGIRYLVVDDRLSTALPETGHYFESGEPFDLVRTQPLDEGALTKFDSIHGVDLLFDSGNIKIYDVGGITGGT
jgi:hypothetical protein